MSWIITPQLKSFNGIPLGTPYEGGYFAGLISHTANQVPTHALIVSPSTSGTAQLAWKTTNTPTSGTDSLFDGYLNTVAMTLTSELLAQHPAASFCVALSLGGYTDWYMPALAELEIAYYNLKPSANLNVLDVNYSSNPYAIARPGVYTLTTPGFSGLTAPVSGFPASGPNRHHWHSLGGLMRMDDGRYSETASRTKSDYSVRAFRRIAL